MSRCFPFPPPGYERKHRPELLDALKEEKRKEKKHKKEKDKERKEGQEKRSKERSDEKHREKKERRGKHKDKKEKHSDKKKREKKDTEKDNEKNSISEKSIIAGKLEGSSYETLHSQGHSKCESSFTNEMKHDAQFLDHNGGNFIQNSLLLQGTEDSKFVQELDRRTRNGTTDSSGVLAEDKEKNKDERVNSRKVDVQRFREEFSANTMVENYAGSAKSKVKATPKPVEEHMDSRLEAGERLKGRSDDNQGEKHEGRDKDNKVHGKDKGKKKEKKREEKAKGIIENGKNKQDVSNYEGWNHLLGVTSNKSTRLLKDINGSSVDEGNIRKIDAVTANGFLHESEVRPNKLQRLTPQQLTENGRKFKASQNHNVSASYKQTSPYNIHSVNDWTDDTLAADKLHPSRPKASTATMTINQDVRLPNEVPKVENLIAEASRRPPHPDSKYVDEILMVPKMDELPSDDVEWLFYKKDPPSSEPKVEFWGFREEGMSVWSEAMYIESADIYALPYVIHY